MKANTAVCFVILGAACYIRQSNPTQKALWRALAILALLISTLTLLEIVFSLDLGIDQLLVADTISTAATSAPGRMSAPTAAAFAILSGSILLADTYPDRRRQPLLIIVLALGLSVFLSYPFSLAYGASLFSYTGMALHTSVFITILAAIPILEMPDRGWVDILFSRSALGTNTRSLLAAALVVPFLAGWLIFLGESRGSYDAGLSRSSYAVVVMLFLATIVILNAIRLQEAETSQRLLQSDLFIVQRQLQGFLDNSPAAIFLKSADGRYQIVNNLFEKLIDRPRHQILGKKAQAFFPKDLIKPVIESDHEVVRSKSVVNTEIRMVVDGVPRTYLNTKFPLLDTDGNVDSIGGIWTDISEQKSLEGTLSAKNVDLERSNKELEQFAYVASHDLQEPLRMVSSYMQLLEARYKDKLDQDAAEFIGYAVDGAHRMQRLIQDLLSFSRVGTRGREPQPVDSQTALDEALQSLKMRIEEAGATVTSQPMPEVLADKDQLSQVFQNLIGNAIKFRGEQPPEIDVSVQPADGLAEFVVRDNGIGFDPKHAERIFVLFQRLNSREKYEGTGIGLAICKKIVERHGGRIWVESQVGKGSAFHFTIPLVAAPEEPAEIDEQEYDFEEEDGETVEDRASRLI